MQIVEWLKKMDFDSGLRRKIQMEEKPGKNPERVPGFSTQNTMLFLLKNRGNTAKKELTIGFGIDVDEAVVSTGLTPVAKSNGCLSIHSRRRANSPSIFFRGNVHGMGVA